MTRRYRREWLILALIGAAALTVLNPRNPQDVSRIGLSLSILERGSLNIDPYALGTSDRAFRDGHWYSDKAPGLSVLALPTVAALRGIDKVAGNPHGLRMYNRSGHIWILRMLTGGMALLLCSLLLGRAAEWLQPGYGAVVALTYALGTIAGPLGSTTFDNGVAAAVAFAAFYLAMKGRRYAFAAGAVAGAAVLFEYQSALIAVALAGYVAIRYGRRSLLAYVGGGVPFAVLLSLYNQATFGSPFHTSYNYVRNQFTERQHEGFFGIGTPTGHGAWFLFFDGRGIFVVSPVLVAAAVGLVLLWRRGFRAEAGLCGFVTLIFIFVAMGYFEPYGGISPGPRFFAPALPFLALGLADAYRRFPAVTALLALYSVTMVTLDSLSWGIINKLQIYFAPHATWAPNTAWSRLPVIDFYTGIYFVYAFVALALAYGAVELVRTGRRGLA
jgi:hypothetical protein